MLCNQKKLRFFPLVLVILVSLTLVLAGCNKEEPKKEKELTTYYLDD